MGRFLSSGTQDRAQLLAWRCHAPPCCTRRHRPSPGCPTHPPRGPRTELADEVDGAVVAAVGRVQVHQELGVQPGHLPLQDVGDGLPLVLLKLPLPRGHRGGPGGGERVSLRLQVTRTLPAPPPAGPRRQYLHDGGAVDGSHGRHEGPVQGVVEDGRADVGQHSVQQGLAQVLLLGGGHCRRRGGGLADKRHTRHQRMPAGLGGGQPWQQLHTLPKGPGTQLSTTPPLLSAELLLGVAKPRHPQHTHPLLGRVACQPPPRDAPPCLLGSPASSCPPPNYRGSEEALPPSHHSHVILQLLQSNFTLLQSLQRTAAGGGGRRAVRGGAASDQAGPLQATLRGGGGGEAQLTAWRGRSGCPAGSSSCSGPSSCLDAKPP